MLRSFDSELEKLNGFETDYVRILYYDLPKGYAGTYQSHGYTRICTILEGEKHIAVRGHEFTYDPHQTLVLPTHSKVHMTIAKPTKALVFELNDALIQTVAKQTDLANNLPANCTALNELLIGAQERNIQEDLMQLIQISAQQETKERFLIDLYSQKLVYHLLQTKEAGRLILNQTQNPMQRAVDFIHKHVHEPLQVSHIARQLHMSESTFSHAFKKEMGMTPQKYMHQVKLERAVSLLATKSVTDTAFELGYENPSHFIKLFKAAYGMTPKQYQLKHMTCL